MSIDENNKTYSEEVRLLLAEAHCIGELRMPVNILDADVEIMNILIDYMANNSDYDT